MEIDFDKIDRTALAKQLAAWVTIESWESMSSTQRHNWKSHIDFLLREIQEKGGVKKNV